jgi:hypothetical protein
MRPVVESLPSKRKKDPAILEMTDTLAHIETVLLDYIRLLRAEVTAEQQRSDQYPPLVTGLNGMIAMLEDFHAFIDGEVWTRLIAVADRSTSHVHRRTRNFF